VRDTCCPNCRCDLRLRTDDVQSDSEWESDDEYITRLVPVRNPGYPRAEAEDTSVFETDEYDEDGEEPERTEEEDQEDDDGDEEEDVQPRCHSGCMCASCWPVTTPIGARPVRPIASQTSPGATPARAHRTEERHRSRSQRHRSRSRPASVESRNLAPCSASSGTVQGQRSRGQRQRKPLLWEAVEQDSLMSVRDILTWCTDVDETFNGWTSLMKAAEAGYVDIMGELLRAGADIEATNNRGRSVLSLAAAPSMGRPTSIAALKLLLVSRADPSRMDSFGHTAQSRARQERRLEAVEILRSYASRASA